MHFKFLVEYLYPIKALFNIFRASLFQVLLHSGVKNITPWVCFLLVIYGPSGVLPEGPECAPRSLCSGWA